MSENFNSPSSTQDSPQEVFDRLSSKWNTLSSRLSLDTVRNEIHAVDQDISELEESLREIRSKGFAFGGNWEKDVLTSRNRWPGEKQTALRVFDQQEETVRKSARSIEVMINRAERNFGLLDDLEQKLGALESEINAAEQRVRSSFARTSDVLGGIYEELEWATFLLDNLKDASFKLFPNENGIAACKAQWVSKKGEPEGILYLSDQRIIFEELEEKATKKVLFITTEKEIVRSLLWEAPIGAIERSKAEDKGGLLGFGIKELLTLEFDRKAKDVPDEATLRFLDYADNEMWENLIDSVKSGRIEQSRYLKTVKRSKTPAISQPKLTFPTACPNCGGKLPKAFKGMQTLDCEFCGNTVSPDNT